MRVAVVYESYFGHTRGVAAVIAEGLRARTDVDNVDIYEVGDAPADLDVDLVVVGGPVHAWTMSRQTTREDGRQQVKDHGQVPISQGPGVREWLHQLVPVADHEHHLAATFDTAVKLTWFPVGSAARPEAKVLAAKGFSIVAPPEHFFVDDTDGPLLPGELDRARAWAQALPTTRPPHA
jgi:hypothetical protein